MATVRVQRNSHYASNVTGSHAGIGVNPDNDLLYIQANSSVGKVPISGSNVVVLTTNRTALAGESGTTFIASSTTSIIVQLPPTQAGLKYTLINNGLTSSGGHAFSPNAADKILYNTGWKADDADLVNSAASDVLADQVTLVADGVDGWVTIGSKGTWA